MWCVCFCVCVFWCGWQCENVECVLMCVCEDTQVRSQVLSLLTAWAILYGCDRIDWLLSTTILEDADPVQRTNAFWIMLIRGVPRECPQLQFVNLLSVSFGTRNATLLLVDERNGFGFIPRLVCVSYRTDCLSVSSNSTTIRHVPSTDSSIFQRVCW